LAVAPATPRKTPAYRTELFVWKAVCTKRMRGGWCREMKEQTHHAEPDDGDTCWEHNKGGKGPLPVNDESESE
jgi:hypothetical protein